MTCTIPACTSPGPIHLQWTETITAGWTITTHRHFCRHHAAITLRRLHTAGIAVEAESSPQRGAA